MASVERFGRGYIAPLMALCVLAPVLALPALATEQKDAVRYEMERVDGGFLRLDRQTGDVSHCREIKGVWACQLVPDERKAYERRIADLERKNADLHKRLNGPGAEADLPTDEEMDKAFSFFDGFMDRFAELARKFRDRMEDMDDTPSDNPQPDGI